jgi:hypothetical protein
MFCARTLLTRVDVLVLQREYWKENSDEIILSGVVI